MVGNSPSGETSQADAVVRSIAELREVLLG
jgi:hypothetical protein